MIIDSNKLDQDINRFLKKSKTAFTADDVITSMAYKFDSPEEAEIFKSRVIREFDGSSDLFKNKDQGEYLLKKLFFLRHLFGGAGESSHHANYQSFESGYRSNPVFQHSI